MVKKAGINIGNGILIKLWKKLLEYQAHDSMGGSVTDNVVVDILHRYKEANEIADGIENMIEKKIAESLKLTSKQIILFNTDPHEFKGRKSFTLLTNY